MSKVIIFGTGKIYSDYQEILEASDIVAFVDNDIRKQGKYINGIEIIAPSKIENLEYEYIVIATVYYKEVYNQLKSLRISERKILSYVELYQLGDYIYQAKLYFKEEKVEYYQKEKVVLFTQTLSLFGGPIVMLYMAYIYVKLGYEVIIVSREDGPLRYELEGSGILLIIDSFNCVQNDAYKQKMANAKYLVFNTNYFAYLIPEFYKINKNIIWWLHEPNTIYNICYKKEFDEYFKKIKIYAVSDVARTAFYDTIGMFDIDLLPYVIPDQTNKAIVDIKSHPKLKILIVGGVCEAKGHDILIKAIESLDDNEKEQVEILMAGKLAKEGSELFIKCIELEKQGLIKCMGVVDREKMQELYNRIDIVVCASRAESFPVAVVEAMMNSRISIVSDNAGICEYIEDRSNGLIFKKEDAIGLRNCIRWCLEHRDEVKYMKVSARNTYEKFFTMDVFKCRIENM